MKIIVLLFAVLFVAACSEAPEPEAESGQTQAAESAQITEAPIADEVVEEVAAAAEASAEVVVEAAEDLAEGDLEEAPVADLTAGLQAMIAGVAVDKSNPDWKTSLPKPEMLTFAADDEIFWLMSTNFGELKFRLFPDVAPMHVTSTLYLTGLGFYDDVIFHRIIQGFMAQGGDPLGRGTGGPGYYYDGEFAPNVSHDRPGLLSMANRGPGTDGSQFFITFVPTNWLDNRHTIFGELIEGAEVLQKMEGVGSQSGATSERVVIEKASFEWAKK